MSYSLRPRGLYNLWNSPGQTLEWVTFPFSRESSQPRDWTQVSHIAGGFFTSWATREAQEYWSGQPIPSPVDLPDPGVEPGSPALQADSLPTELSGKPVRKAFDKRCRCTILTLWNWMWHLCAMKQTFQLDVWQHMATMKIFWKLLT